MSNKTNKTSNKALNYRFFEKNFMAILFTLRILARIYLEEIAKPFLFWDLDPGTLTTRLRRLLYLFITYGLLNINFIFDEIFSNIIRIINSPLFV